MSTQPAERDQPRESVAGFLAAVSIFASVFALIPAFSAPGIGGRHKGLAAFAVVFGAACFVAAMIIAVATGHPLY